MTDKEKIEAMVKAVDEFVEGMSGERLSGLTNDSVIGISRLMGKLWSEVHGIYSTGVDGDKIYEGEDNGKTKED